MKPWRERFGRWLCAHGLHDWRTRKVFYAPAVSYGSVALTPRVIGEECRRQRVIAAHPLGAFTQACGARRVSAGFPEPLPDSRLWSDAKDWATLDGDALAVAPMPLLLGWAKGRRATSPPFPPVADLQRLLHLHDKHVAAYAKSGVPPAIRERYLADMAVRRAQIARKLKALLS